MPVNHQPPSPRPTTAEAEPSRARWTEAGVLDHIRDRLRRRIRVNAGRCPRPVTAIIDSPSVLVVDTKGLLMTVKVTAAEVIDRDAARALLPGLRDRHPELTLMWADNAYTGLPDWARTDLDLTFKIVKKPPVLSGGRAAARKPHAAFRAAIYRFAATTSELFPLLWSGL